MAGALGGPAAGQTEPGTRACGAPAELMSADPSGPLAALARALGITSHVSPRGGDYVRAANSTTQVCADSLDFLEAWRASPVFVSDALVAPFARAALHSNSDYPRERNNGVLWNGVGTNLVLAAGAHARWRFLTAALLPVFVHQENAPFEVAPSRFAGRSEFANPDHFGIDWPKRHGGSAFGGFDLGQSFLAAGWGPLEAAISNENLWIGPGQLQSLLLTNTAPGFPHLRLGTRRPLDLWIAKGEVDAFWGEVEESEFFDGNPENDAHLLAGTVVTLEPRGLTGLYLGLARLYHDTEPLGGHDLGFYLGLLGESPFWDQGGNRRGNAIGVLFARWVLPESGFETYMEWGREDTPGNLENLLRVPDDTHAWLVGFQKTFTSAERLTRVYGEVVTLGQPAPVRGGRGFYSFYTHGTVPQGHTHRGQLLGAWIGPGSDSQTVGLEVFERDSRSGLMLERVRYDEDVYYRRFARRYGESRHDVEVTAEARRMQRLGPVWIEAVLRLSRRYDPDFNSLREERDPEIGSNVGTELTVSWRPGR
jgi:hypothetical protein